MAWNALNVYTRYKTWAAGEAFTPAQINAIQDEYGNKFTPQAWQVQAIAGANVTGTNVDYMKDALGFVHMRGDLISTTGAVGDGTAIGTLPAGYRPGTTQYFAAAGSRAVMLSVSAGGVITVVQGLAGAGATTFALSSICFLAEN